MRKGGQDLLDGMLVQVGPQQWTMLEHCTHGNNRSGIRGAWRSFMRHCRTLPGKHLERGGRQLGVVLAIEVLVEPVCRLDLETDTLKRPQFLLGQIDDEATVVLGVRQGKREARRRGKA